MTHPRIADSCRGTRAGAGSSRTTHSQIERPSLRKKNRQNSIVKPEVTIESRDDVIDRAPVASDCLFEFTHSISSVRIWLTKLLMAVVSTLMGPCSSQSTSCLTPDVAWLTSSGTCSTIWLVACDRAAMNTTKNSSRPTVAASAGGKWRRRRSHSTRGCRKTAIASAIATGRRTSWRRDASQMTPATTATTTTTRQETAAPTRSVRGTEATMSFSTSSSRSTRGGSGRAS